MKSEPIWELMGFVMGFLVSILIILQIHTDLTDPNPSSISILATIGWTLVCGFWTCYGLKFSRVAIWSPNLLAAICQIALLTLIVLGY